MGRGEHRHLKNRSEWPKPKNQHSVVGLRRRFFKNRIKLIEFISLPTKPAQNLKILKIYKYIYCYIRSREYIALRWKNSSFSRISDLNCTEMARDERILPLLHSNSGIHCLEMPWDEKILPSVIGSRALIASRWLGMKEFCLCFIRSQTDIAPRCLRMKNLCL